MCDGREICCAEGDAAECDDDCDRGIQLCDSDAECDGEMCEPGYLGLSICGGVGGPP
jgi:hypothetical protein